LVGEKICPLTFLLNFGIFISWTVKFSGPAFGVCSSGTGSFSRGVESAAGSVKNFRLISAFLSGDFFKRIVDWGNITSVSANFICGGYKYNNVNQKIQVQIQIDQEFYALLTCLWV